MKTARIVAATVAVMVAGCHPGQPTSPSGAATVSPPRSTEPSASSNPTSAPTFETFVPWIAYQRDGIRLVHPDGTEDHALPGIPPGAQHPDWSLDGKRLTFVVDEDDSRDIWIVAVDGGEARRVFDCEGECVDADGPAFSPDGGSIAFRVFPLVDGAFRGSRLMVLDLDSGESRVVATTDAPAFIGNGTPIRWSRDGRSLVMDISTIKDPGVEGAEEVLDSAIAVVSLDDPAGEPRTITELDTFPTYPDWSPTEDLLVFMARAGFPADPDDLPSNLFTIRPDGTGLTQLTNFDVDHDVWGPTWAPDGASVWVQLLDPEFTLAVVLADGSGFDVVPGPILGGHPREQPIPD